MTMFWSAKNNAFFPSDMVETYEAAGWVLDDTIEATEEMIVYQGPAPVGKIRAAGADGMPSWSDIPGPSAEEIKSQAETTKSSLKAESDSEISWRQDAVDAGIATDAETTELAAWRKYRIQLMRVDTSTAPDITWPTPPDSMV